MQQDITIRLIKVYDSLKADGHVRSARQFALSIGTYAQSFNEVLKGRREATLGMIQVTAQKYPVNAHYLLTGEGDLYRQDIYGVSVSPTHGVRFIRAHEFSAFAAEQTYGDQQSTGVQWQLPMELTGQKIDLAFQCNTDRLMEGIKPGDTLFMREVPEGSWKSSLSSKRAYAILFEQTIHLIRITNNDGMGIYLLPDEQALPVFIEFEDIGKIWSLSSYLSSHCMVEAKEYTNWASLNELIKAQSASIQTLQSTITDLTSSSKT